MKKKYFFAAYVFLIVFVIGSCSDIWRNIERKVIHGNGLVTTQVRSITSDYRKIRSQGSFNVVLISDILISDIKDSITIEADENIIPYILTKVENDILIIKFQEGVHVRGTLKKLQVTVPVQNINEISLQGSGNIKSKNAKVNAENVSILVDGSGYVDIDIDGETDTLRAEVKGSGYIHAYKLASDVVTAIVRGSGKIKTTVIVMDEFKVTIDGSGDIFYKGTGTPSKHNTNIKGSGKIEQKD